MVWLTPVEGGGVVLESSPVSDYLQQSHVSFLDQIPNTHLTSPPHQLTGLQASSLFSSPDSTTSPHFYQSGDISAVDSTLGMSSTAPFVFEPSCSGNENSLYHHAPEAFSTFVDNMPATRLDSSYVPADTSAEDATRTFTVVPVPEGDNCDEVDNTTTQNENWSAVDNSTTQNESWSAVDNSTTQSENWSAVDNSSNGQDWYAVDSSVKSDNWGVIDSSFEKKFAGAESVDSLNYSKGYSSDSSSDVYMNSDYTDTVTSTTSSAFLLPPAKAEPHVLCTEGGTDFNSHNSKEPMLWSSEESVQEKKTEKVLIKGEDNVLGTDWIVTEPESPGTGTVTPCYSNTAFSDNSPNSKELISWSSEESVQEQKTEKVLIKGEDNVLGTDWIVTMPEEEDSGEMADKEDEEDSEKKELVPLNFNSNLEDLVSHLAEQHGSQVMDINVQVLDGPVYESLTEPFPDHQERHWLQSTESLRHYKLLKQGRLSAVNTLRVQAAHNNLRANTMSNLHERNSFVNLTAASVTSLGNACQKALAYVRADMEFGSMMSLKDGFRHLSATTTTPGKGQPPSDLEALSSDFKQKGEPAVASGRHCKNVLLMSLLVTLLLISVNATRNLQSSLNQEGGVGITCLAIMFASYMLGSLLSPVLVQGLGVKSCIVGGLVFQLIYVAANLHPVMWVMVPASLGGGASLALIWNAMSTYIVLLAKGEALSKQMSYERVSDKFFGIFCLIYQSNLIIGNLIASLVLTFGDSGGSSVAAANALFGNGTGLNSTTAAVINATLYGSTHGLSPVQEVGADLLGMTVGGDGEELHMMNSMMNSSTFDPAVESHYHLCGSAYCHSFVLNKDSSSAVSDKTIYLLFGIFMALVLITIGMAVCLLEPLNPRFSAAASSAHGSSAWQNVKRQLVSLAKFSKNLKFLLLLPLMLYSVMQFSFVCSEVMMAYVTCPMGVWLVGYTMIAYGVCCSVASYITQVLVPRFGRTFFIVLATALNVGLLVFMRLWQPHPDSILPLFVLTSLFGLADGIWNVNANGLCGSVFPDHFEEAFTGLRVAQGLGGAFSMAYAPFFCMAVKIYIMIAVVIVVLVGYIGAEVLIKRDARKAATIFEKEIV